MWPAKKTVTTGARGRESYALRRLLSTRRANTSEPRMLPVVHRPVMRRTLPRMFDAGATLRSASRRVLYRQQTEPSRYFLPACRSRLGSSYPASSADRGAFAWLLSRSRASMIVASIRPMFGPTGSLCPFRQKSAPMFHVERAARRPSRSPI
jgi:hypothetical protein